MHPVHRRAQRRRGSAFIEALAVTLLFSALLAAAVSISRVYAAKLRAVSRARQEAWQNTQRPCATRRSTALATATLFTCKEAIRGDLSPHAAAVRAVRAEVTAGLERVLP